MQGKASVFTKELNPQQVPKTLVKSQYWQHFNLKYDPFLPWALANDIYVPSHWKNYHSLAINLTKKNDNLIVITGISGSGKTTFARYLATAKYDEKKVCFFSAKNTFRTEQIKALLIKYFSLPHFFSSKSFKEKKVALTDSLHDQPFGILIIIDDAEYLENSAVKMLLQLLNDSKHAAINHLQIIMVGSLDLVTHMEQASNHTQQKLLIHYLQLQALTFEQVQEYIEHCCYKAGFIPPLPLTETNYKKLYQSSSGNIGKINLLVREMLMKKVFPNFNWANFLKYAKKILLFIGGTILLVGLFNGPFIKKTFSPYLNLSTLFSWPDSYKPTVKKSAKTLARVDVVPSTELLAPLTKSLPDSNQDLLSEASNESMDNYSPDLIQTSPTNDPLLPPAGTDSSPHEVDGEFTQGENSNQLFKSTKKNTGETKPTEIDLTSPNQSEFQKHKPQKIEQAQDKREENNFAQDKQNQSGKNVLGLIPPKAIHNNLEKSPAHNTVDYQEQSNKIAANAANSLGFDQPVFDFSETSPLPRTSPPVQKIQVITGKNKFYLMPAPLNWWIKAPSHHFTIQLMQMNNLEDIENFVNEKGIKAYTTTVRLHVNHKVSYILITGNYPTYAKAREAILSLPPYLQKTMIRPIKTLPQEQYLPAICHYRNNG